MNRLRRGVILLLLLGGFCFGVENPKVFEFPEASTLGTNWKGEAPWANAFTKACKARKSGLGLAPPEDRSGVIATFEKPENMASLSVVCVASSKTAAKRKENVLGISINGGEMVRLAVCFNGEQNVPITVTHTWSEVQEVTTLRLTNETTNGALFEIQQVSWEGTFAPIAVTPVFPSRINIGTPFNVSAPVCSGGSGAFESFVWTFNGETVETTSGDVCVPFTAPAQDGTYPLTLTVTDSALAEAEFAWQVEVTPYAFAENLAVSNQTRTGFTLTWDQPSAHAVASYEVTAKRRDVATAAEGVSRVVWEQVDDVLQAELPVASLTGGLAVTTAYVLPAHGTFEALTFSADGGTTWKSALELNGRYNFGTLPAGVSSLLLRTPTAEPPAFLRLVVTCSATVAKATLSADGQARQYTFTDLPAGSELAVSVTTHNLKDDGKTFSMVSDALAVDLEAVPTPSNILNDSFYTYLAIERAESEKAFGTELAVYAEEQPASALSAGLYLSRVYYAKSTTDSTGATLSAGKAIVLSNASFSPVTLNGSYTLRVRKTASDGSTADDVWDFGAKDGEPIVIDPWEEYAFTCARSNTAAPVELPENTLGSTASALYNITDAKVVALYRGETCINALCPVSNAVVRLKPDSLESETFAVSASDNYLPAFASAWTSAPTPKLLLTKTFASGSYPYLDYTTLLTENPDARRIWLEAVFLDGSGRSAPATVILKSAPAAGFRLLLR